METETLTKEEEFLVNKGIRDMKLYIKDKETEKPVLLYLSDLLKEYKEL